MVSLGWALQPTFAETKGDKKDINEATKAENLEKLRGLLETLAGASSKQKAKVGQPPPIMITTSEVDKLRLHMAKCWSPPKEASKNEPVVDLKLKLNPDGYVVHIEIPDAADEMSKNRVSRVMADAAIKAVRQCQPLPLPKEKYELWKEFIFSFDATHLYRY